MMKKALFALAAIVVAVVAVFMFNQKAPETTVSTQSTQPTVIQPPQTETSPPSKRPTEQSVEQPTVLATNINLDGVTLIEGTQYITLAQEHTAQPQVIEFFSFYCPHCYQFELVYQIPNQVKAGLPEGTEFKQYHVDFLGPQGENLTRAWALAMALGAENKVKTALFEAAQANAFKSMDDIRQKFIDNGISAEQFDGAINSFAVNALVKKQQNLAAQFQVHGVPDFYVNGKFRVNPEGLSHDDFVNDYVKTVIGLLKK